MDIQPTVTDMQTMCEDFMHRGRFAKTEMCKDEAMMDNPPILLIGFPVDENSDDYEDAVQFQQEFGTSKPYRVALLPLTHRDDVVDCITDIVKHLPPQPFSFIALAAEGYSRVGGKDLPTDYERGDMESDFKENPFTDVRETLIITAVDWGCEHIYSSMSPYTYDDAGVPVFSEDDEHSAFSPLGGIDNVRELLADTELGRIPSVLISFVLFMHYATEATKFTDKLSNAPKRKKGNE